MTAILVFVYLTGFATAFGACLAHELKKQNYDYSKAFDGSTFIAASIVAILWPIFLLMLVGGSIGVAVALQRKAKTDSTECEESENA